MLNQIEINELTYLTELVDSGVADENIIQRRTKLLKKSLNPF